MMRRDYCVHLARLRVSNLLIVIILLAKKKGILHDEIDGRD